MLFYSLSTAWDAGSTLEQHYVNVSWLVGKARVHKKNKCYHVVYYDNDLFIIVTCVTIIVLHQT